MLNLMNLFTDSKVVAHFRCDLIKGQRSSRGQFVLEMPFVLARIQSICNLVLPATIWQKNHTLIQK